ncbi:1-deoxy-D-xylulose-5-phosphate synthase [Phosphitispora fastidiosa]|uniref:1-deoxy-D-xylulose-5-phosphate synthase n=1 Tax=Phosphitispora fastidiosa TaxID=2837202 RepID=UPI001E4CEBDF|nr:1-deoxy-D-xylulose-5-phosphate synthase [Phosphitispora fastidiosa]MBU7007664.1 1-deoxy-D-xylulose-5-phosphate synthase [Phosphitispora fastidiosa]
MDTPLLNKIDSPADLKGFSIEQLYKLADEIRGLLIETVAETGGHIAPNLGVVELTIALHSIFDCPSDKIIWDVGHQSYIHKILTGRREGINTLRQYSGISGFPKRAESHCDPFDTGHSSTSISAALGMAIARDLRGEKNNIIAVIGDGAMTGGMAFEALNHAGHIGSSLIVILNDNEMSISENVGALAGYLSRMRTDPKYYKHKEEMELLMKKIPSIGSTVVKAMERIKDSFKYLVVPGMLFEELGFTYLGPINGHDISVIRTVLERARKSHGPVLVHVITKKGKGYQPAEDNPDKFHGIGPFDVKTGNVRGKSKITYTKIFGETLCQLAAANEKVLAITAAMPTGTGLTEFRESFPGRFFDVGIAEQHAVTLAAGLAVSGYIPVVALYSTFLQRAYDQVLHDVALQGLHVVFAIDRAGLVGEDGETHQGVFDISFLRHIPGLAVMAPKDEGELRQMLRAAIEQYGGPAVIRYPRGAGVGVKLEDLGDISGVPFGKAEIVREGNHITIAALGPMVNEAMRAAELLAELGTSAEVINARFVKPLDEECILKSINRTGRLLTVEENVLQGGFGSAVLEMMEKHEIMVPVKRIGVPDKFVSHGAQDTLREQCGLTSSNIFEEAQGMVSGSLKTKSRRGKANIKRCYHVR